MNKYERFMKYTLPQTAAIFVLGLCLDQNLIIKIIGGISVLFLIASNYIEGKYHG